MDISVLAAVGSFAVSERILKPKATVLAILGCILCYDLTTKTHDVSSLRVYRGPALLAVTLMCAAYSLRTWRRNGVACDELIFLPGTRLGQSHGIEEPLIEEPEPPPPESPPRNEGDAAAGLAYRDEPLGTTTPSSNSNQSRTRRQRTLSSESGGPLLEQGALGADRTEEMESWDEDDDNDEIAAEIRDEEASWASGAESGEGWPRPNILCQTTNPDEASSSGALEIDGDEQTGLERFRENHPRITRIGTFFFFRSASTIGDSATYAPSGPSVFGAALDLSMPILFNFHLFIEAYNHIVPGDKNSELTAKILPLIFLSVLLFRSVFPPGRRRRFWSIVKFTAMAPFHRVGFRDAFLGDVLTSLVRPIQDILFALSYYATVIYGTLIGSYGLREAGEILEKSWFLHNVLLPACALLPLWWKFLQTVRQQFDTNKRWPYAGDSFKYLTAAMVIVYGMNHPEERRSAWWLICFVLCTLYQIVWDTVIDWELFVIAPRREGQAVPCESPFCASISSLRPSSRVLLALQMYIVSPIVGFFRKITSAIPAWEQIQLRPKRLYKTENFYLKIFFMNCLLRFGWMLCFIPSYRISSDGEDSLSKSDVNSYVGVLLPVAEIIRRCCWGFIKLEVETLRLMEADILYSPVDEEENTEDDDVEEKDRSFSSLGLPTWLDVQQKQQQTAATSSSHSRIADLLKFNDSLLRRIFIAELSLWAVAFVGLGYWSAL